MNADDISKLIKRIFAGIVSVIVAIGQIIDRRRSAKEKESSSAQIEAENKGRKRKLKSSLEQDKKIAKKQAKKP